MSWQELALLWSSDHPDSCAHLHLCILHATLLLAPCVSALLVTKAQTHSLSRERMTGTRMTHCVEHLSHCPMVLHSPVYPYSGPRHPPWSLGSSASPLFTLHLVKCKESRGQASSTGWGDAPQCNSLRAIAHGWWPLLLQALGQAWFRECPSV